MTLYTSVSRNKTNSVLLLTFFLVFAITASYIIGQAFDVPWLLPFVTIVSLVQAWASYYYSDKIALVMARAVPLDRREYDSVYDTVENLTITAGLPMPQLYLINDTAPNAFATGRDPQHASIAVTAGLIAKLDKSELQGVLAHELSHIGNYDILFMSMVVVLLGVITMISDLALRSTWYRRGGGDRGDDQLQLVLMIVGILLAILAPLIATLIQLAISRKREFLADSTGALMTRYPEGLANALRKIAADSEPLEVANNGTAHLYIENPFKENGKVRSRLASLFDTHPPVQERIKALLEGGGVRT